MRREDILEMIGGEADERDEEMKYSSVFREGDPARGSQTNNKKKNKKKDNRN